MTTIGAIRHLLKEQLITERQAARIAVRHLKKYTKEGESTSARKNIWGNEPPVICPTCRQEVLPF